MTLLETAGLRFSVLVPVYNAEKYLEACIQSVLQQTYQNYELILVNDGSKDGSGAICDRYAQEYENIRVYHKENGGQLHARQCAIRNAHGDYYIFLDADDTLRRNALQTLAEKILLYNCDCVIFQYERVWEGKVLSNAPRFADICITDKRGLYQKCFMSNAYNSMCRKAVRATMLSGETDYSAYYHVRFAEDLLQSLEVMQNSQRVVFVDDVLYNYTVNPNSVTQSVKYENYKIDFSVRMRVASFLQESAVLNEDDVAAYRGYCAKLFCGEIFSICGFAIPGQEKKRLLEKLRSTSYYQDFLARGGIHWEKLGARKIVFQFFKRGYDYLLIAMLTIYTIARKYAISLFREGK